MTSEPAIDAIMEHADVLKALTKADVPREDNNGEPLGAGFRVHYLRWQRDRYREALRTMTTAGSIDGSEWESEYRKGTDAYEGLQNIAHAVLKEVDGV